MLLLDVDLSYNHSNNVTFFSCVTQWNSYQEARQTVIELMNEAEKKLTEFSTAKAATSQEAEEKLCSHKVIQVCRIDSLSWVDKHIQLSTWW